MTVEKIVTKEIALNRTLDKVNREIGMAAPASKRLARLNAESSVVANKLRRRRQVMPDR